MAQIAPSLKKKLSNNPTQSQNIIVRVNCDLTEAQNKLIALGFQVRRRLSLIKGLAVTGSSQNVQSLSAEPWVMSIEEDQQVRTM